jgi:hypothetical protein
VLGRGKEEEEEGLVQAMKRSSPYHILGIEKQPLSS